MQRHRLEPHLHPISLSVVEYRSFSRKQGELRTLLDLFIEGLDDPAPRFALAVVDLA